MTPHKLDITINRGTSYELELISQIKKFTFDPEIHTTLMDKRRTHAENLEHYGFIYEYINFLETYTTAELIVRKPWAKDGQPTKALLSLNLENGIQLTNMSVKIGIPPGDTRKLEFDSGNYELNLTTPAGKIDGLIFGSLTVNGEQA